MLDEINDSGQSKDPRANKVYHNHVDYVVAFMNIHRKHSKQFISPHSPRPTSLKYAQTLNCVGAVPQSLQKSCRNTWQPNSKVHQHQQSHILKGCFPSTFHSRHTQQHRYASIPKQPQHINRHFTHSFVLSSFVVVDFLPSPFKCTPVTTGMAFFSLRWSAANVHVRIKSLCLHLCCAC